MVLQLSEEIRIDRPPEVVWRHVTDLDEELVWRAPYVVDLDADGDPLVAGCRISGTTRAFGQTETYRNEVTEVDAPHRLAWRGREASGALMGSEGAYELAGRGDGTVFRLTLTYQPQGLTGRLEAPVLGPVMRRIGRRFLRQLKDRVEAGSVPCPSPRDRAAALEERADLPDVPDRERLRGYAVTGLPFRSGHLLAMRRFPATSFGPGYTSVWHRHPDGRLVIYQDQEPRFGCPRVFGPETDEVRVVPIDLRWPAPDRLRLEVDAATGSGLTWEMTLSLDGVTRALNAVPPRLPQRLRRHPLFLGAVSRGAGALLGAGRIRLTGTVPSGQQFAVDLGEVWRIGDAHATVDDCDLGVVGAVEGRQPHLADFWLPRRGILVFADAYFEPYDSGRHVQVASRAEIRRGGRGATG
ncbi:SRPBCC family protein [Blastococcus tunisiensis]|uniref:Uncharacterized conserved protein YndB, AHSA1/START domain n=1 Tax=Blastococcus tunisiensis TaxID=1798228 RepID=A0A1I2I872_9ACTN|nr:SRPBCC family protein [Blastococcus sp. DSM 46838]SFF38475.1 Uncharacterized conserved protein YndB, AHSA1/START domain [Blastococcus sp. DSM 46838]